MALVTGGSRGIGRGIALELAKAGCALVLSARDEAALRSVAAEVEALGSKAHVVVADLLADDASERLARAVARETGRLDILVNNAGAVRRGDFFRMTPKEWHDGFGVKFFLGRAWAFRLDVRDHVFQQQLLAESFVVNDITATLGLSLFLPTRE